MLELNETDDIILKVGYNKPFILMMTLIFLGLFICLFIAHRQMNSMNAIGFLLQMLLVIQPFLFFSYFPYLFQGPFLILSQGEIIHYYRKWGFNVTDVFEWSEIEHFENINNAILPNKIRIVAKNSHFNNGRVFHIIVRNSQISSDELCTILNEELKNYNRHIQDNGL